MAPVFGELHFILLNFAGWIWGIVKIKSVANADQRANPKNKRDCPSILHSIDGDHCSVAYTSRGMDGSTTIAGRGSKEH